MTPTEYFTDSDCITYTKEEVEEMIRKAQWDMIKIFQDIVNVATEDNGLVSGLKLKAMLSDI